MTTIAVRTKPRDCEGNSSSHIRLDHPHVVTVYEYGGDWLTMELVDGGTATALAEQGRSAGGADPDRRRAGLHPSVRNRALRCQAVQHPCFSGLFPRGVDRLRCCFRGRRDRLDIIRLTSKLRCRTRLRSCCAADHRRPAPMRTRWPARQSNCCWAHHRSRPRRRWNWWTPISANPCRASHAKSLGCQGLSTRYGQGIGEDPGQPL